jgi:Homeodomain-like domain
VLHWRDRYVEGGLAALEDRKRSGRPRRVDEGQVVVATLTPPPQRLGVTHWSSRLLAAELGIGFATVARIWRDWDLACGSPSGRSAGCRTPAISETAAREAQPGRSSGRFAARLPCSRPVDWPTSMRYPSGSRM